MQPLTSAVSVGPALPRFSRAADSGPWLQTVLRTSSQPLLDELAHVATGGRYSAGSLLKLAVAGELPLVERDVPVQAAAVLGTTWACAAEPAAMKAGHLLLRRILGERGPQAFSRIQQQIFAQVSYHLGARADVAHAVDELDLHPLVRWSLQTDLLNPTHQGSTQEAWLQRFNEPFVAADLSPVAISAGAQTTFDDLTAATTSASVDGPLVSVIVPAFRPDEGLLTSLHSILNQTYGNLEILLVDDASGHEFEELFDRGLSLDERICFIRQQANGGTYLARNAALKRARGEFITVQDADDWSHPSRLEKQVGAFFESPNIGVSRSDAIRATDDLTLQWTGYLPRRRNASSLMFRRSTVDQIGPFDAVRKGADSEYHERLIHFVGPTGDTGTPLAITRLRAGTLSRGDFTYGRMAPDRVLYQSTYRAWHRTLLDRDTVPTSVGDPASRPFFAPPSFLRGLTAVPTEKCDVIFLLDGAHLRSVQIALEAVRQLPQLTFGALHLEDSTQPRMKLAVPVRPFATAVNDGDIQLIASDEKVRAATLVVLSPGILASPPSLLHPISTASLLAVAHPPHPRFGVTDFLAAQDGALAWLDTAPKWCAGNPSTQALWRSDGWELPLLTSALGIPQSGETE